jgi:hypothetical protein
LHEIEDCWAKLRDFRRTTGNTRTTSVSRFTKRAALLRF